MPGPVFLGKIQLRWCRDCNLPVLEEIACTCGSRTHPVALTPPGDAYPAVGVSLDSLKNILDEDYGPGVGKTLLPEDKLALLSNIPFKDRAMEVVLDGHIIGRSFYNPEKAEWQFKPTMEGARRLDEVTQRKKIMVDQGAVEAIGKGGSLLAPGVLSADPSIEPGDEVMLLNPNGELFSIGSARMSGREMVINARGMAAKVREVERYRPPDVLPGGQSWDDAVEANQVTLRRCEEEAIGFIRKTVGSHRLPTCVAFSGGKDSLCTLLLVSRAIDDFKVIFIDTGIEFPETVEYTKRILAELGVGDRLITKSMGNRFWSAMEIFGPPARDARWCCKVCKLGPTTSIIQEHFDGQCLTFVGQRRYESQQRLGRKRVSRNPWVPGQVAASPIREWTALHVWLYIFREKAEMNPLYYRGYARIGCSVCPASEMAELHLLARTHPEISASLVAEIRRQGEEGRMPPEWLHLGLWRWRRSPAWAPELEGDFEDRYECIKPIDFRRSEAGDGPVLSAKLGDGFPLERIANALEPLGQVTSNDGGVNLRSSGIHIAITAEGEVVVVPSGKEELAKAVSRRVASCIVKATYCVGCGTCVGSCHLSAIRIKDDRAWIGQGCTHCGSCIDLCPLLTWAIKTPVRPFG